MKLPATIRRDPSLFLLLAGCALAALVGGALGLRDAARASTVVSSAADRIEVSAADFPAALAAARDGQTIVVGAGRILAPPGGFKVSAQVRIVGAWPGRNRVTCGTIVVPQLGDTGFVIARGPDHPGNIRLESLIVDGPGDVGIAIDADGRPAHLELVRCMVQGCRVGLEARATGTLDAMLVQECSFCRCLGPGARVSRGAWARFVDCYFAGNQGEPLVLDRCDRSEVTRSYVEGNGKAMRVLDTMAARIDDVTFERFAPDTALVISGGRAVRVTDCAFLSGAPMVLPAGVSVAGFNCAAPVVDRCFHRVVAAMTTWSNCPGYVVSAQSRVTW